MFTSLKRMVWLLFHPRQRRAMKRAWQSHLDAIREYAVFKADFRRKKRQSGYNTLHKKRQNIRKSGQRVVSTATSWLDYSTEIPWIN